MTDTTEPEFPIRFSGMLPTRPIAWGVAGFFVVFLAFAMASLLLGGQPDNDGTNSIVGLIAGVIAGLFIGFWPRPRFARDFIIRREGITVIDRNGGQLDIGAESLHMIAAEATFKWGSMATEPWGRLHIRSQDKWVAIQAHPQEARSLYSAMLRYFPHLLGISGEHAVDVPAIGDIHALPEWLDRVRRTYQRESRRQIGFACFYALLMAVGGVLCFSGLFERLVLRNAQGFHNLLRVSLLGLFFVGGAIAYSKLAVRHMRMRAQVFANLKRLQRESGIVL